MTFPLRIFVSSPGDVKEERLRASLVIQKLARDYRGLADISPYIWETEPLRASGHFQDEIEAPSRFDIVVLILWSRLGTPLPVRTAVREYRGKGGRAPVTGTEWEFEDALMAFEARQAPDILTYRRRGDPGTSLTDEGRQAAQKEQWAMLQAFWSRHFENRGEFIAASAKYDTLEEFDARLEADLANLIERRIRARAVESGDGERLHLKHPPYRGLSVYEFGDAPVFFGRDGATRAGLVRLAKAAEEGQPTFLMVLGASGAGKSSLARAGLLPGLVAAKAIPGIGLWRRVVMRPGDQGGDPVHALAMALLTGDPKLGEGLAELAGPSASAAELARHLRASAQDASFPFRVALEALADRERHSRALLAHEEARLVLLVDQLEELFTRPEIAAPDRLAFARILTGLARSGLVWVICTMRSDLWHRAAEIPDLLDVTEAGARIDLLPPDGAELLEMVRRPARAVGLAFDEDRETHLGLDAVVAEAAAAEPGALPLLSVVLEDLYRRDVLDRSADARRLTFATYRAIGELRGAIAARAEAVHRALEERDPDAASQLPAVLRALVTTTVGDAVTSRAAPLDDLPAGTPARRLVEAMLAPEVRLLTASGDGRQATVRLAHEALIAHWPRARDQIARDRRDLETEAILQRLLRLRGSSTASGTLLADQNLAFGIDLAHRWAIPAASPLGAFIAASARRARTRRHLATGISAALALIFAAIAGFAVLQSREADAQRVAAEASAREAESSRVEAIRAAAAERGAADLALMRERQAQASAVLAEGERARAETQAGISARYLRAAASLGQAALRQPVAPDAPLPERAALLTALEGVLGLVWSSSGNDEELSRVRLQLLQDLFLLRLEEGRANAAADALGEQRQIISGEIARRPDDDDWRSFSVAALINEGDLARRGPTGPSGGRELYDEALRRAEALPQGRGGRVLALALERVAQFERDAGDLGRSRERLVSALALRRALLAVAPGDEGLKRETGRTLLALAQNSFAMRDPGAATGEAEEAVTMRRAVANRPREFGLRLELATALATLVGARLARGDPPAEVQAAVREGIGLAGTLAAERPDLPLAEGLKRFFEAELIAAP